MQYTASALDTAFEGLKDSMGEISVQAVIIEEQPAITSDDLKTIEDVLDLYLTFPAAARARFHQPCSWCGKINGRVLMPGEVISGYMPSAVYSCKENGYKAAAAYEMVR